MKSLVTALLLLLSLAPTSPSVAAPESGPKVLSIALSTEPPQLNSMKATDSESFFVLGHVMEGLTRLGKAGEILPGVAERWTLDDKGATFHLRKDARWSDGKPVTAQDFIFAWRNVVDPKTASEYAFILFPLKNAEAINQGKQPLSTLGVSAPDVHTLKVTFEKPCGYFLGLTAFATYLPVREDFFKTKLDRYAADAADLLANGPFVLTSWVHGASLRMEKNPHYWNKAAIKLDAIDIPYITPDNNARFNFFKDRKIDLLLGLSKDDIQKAQSQKFKMKSFSDGTLLFLEFNFREGRPTANLNLRKAIQAAFDGQEFVSKVVGIPGTRPGKGVVPAWVPGAKKLFREEFPLAAPRPDLAAAKRFADQARKELGGTIPPLVFLTGDTPLSAKEAEYFQRLFKSVLGIELRIDKQIFKQRLAKMSSGDFDIVAAGWGPDFPDPMTFAELFTSWNENNRGKWKNPEYDRHIRAAQSTADAKKRMEAMAAAEKIALEELAILPTYERTVVYVTADGVEGVNRRAVGADPDLSLADINLSARQGNRRN